MPDSRVFRDVLADLRAALEANPTRAEKPEERFRLIRPFEKALALFNELPNVVIDNDLAGKIATLLWQKTHPERANLDSLLAQIRDDDVWVRTTAAAALSASIEHQSDAGSDQQTLHRTRVALEQQRYLERSPVIAFQLEQIINELKSAAAPDVATGMTAVHNPYVAGPPLRDSRRFFGRDDILNALRHTLGEGSGTRSVVIQGGRRTGKTSLLYRIREGALGDSLLPVYFDMQSVPGKPLPAFLEALARAIAEATGGPSESGNEARLLSTDFDYLQNTIEQAIAGAKNRVLVLMFDEYEVFKDYLADGRLARQFQSLLERQPTLAFIFAGAQKIEALKERHFQLLLDDCAYMKISFLSAADAGRLIVEPAQGVLDFPEAIVAQITSLTAGHPFYIQSLCQIIFDELQRAKRHVVTSEDVDRAILHFVENPAPHLVLGWNALALDEKVAASTLAVMQDHPDPWVTSRALARLLTEERYPIRVVKSEMQQALVALREQDWVVKREGEQAFRLTIKLVQRWVVEHRSIWYLVEEQRRALVDRTAHVGRRAWSALVDILIIGILSFVTSDLVSQSFFAVAAVYPPAFLLLYRATPGMLLLRIRVVSEAGVRLHPARSVTLGLLAVLPLLMVGLAVLLIWTSEFVAIALIVLALGIIAGHAWMVHFGRKKRGLFDKLTRAVFVVQPKG